MRKSYVIQWKSKVNGRAGRGTKLFSREEGEQLMEELNREYPDITHELAESDQEPQAGPAPKETEPNEQEPEAERGDIPTPVLERV